MKVLIVEDNQILSWNIKKYLELEWIDAFQLFWGKWLLFHLVSNHYDVMILDLGLWDSDGKDLCHDIRNNGNNLPIIMLTARTSTKEKIIWLNAGADDYLCKPFDYEELLVRLKTIVRRNFSQKADTIKIGELEIHENEKLVLKKWKDIDCSNLEFQLLLYLARNKGKVISKEELFEKVWGEFDAFANSRSVDVYVGYLRKKLWKSIIETKRGMWYIIP